MDGEGIAERYVLPHVLGGQSHHALVVEGPHAHDAVRHHADDVPASPVVDELASRGSKLPVVVQRHDLVAVGGNTGRDPDTIAVDLATRHEIGSTAARELFRGGVVAGHEEERVPRVACVPPCPERGVEHQLAAPARDPIVTLVGGEDRRVACQVPEVLDGATR